MKEIREVTQRRRESSAGHAQDPRAVVLRSELLNLAARAAGMTHADMLDAVVQISWGHDLNREIIGAKAIAEAVFGDDSPAAVSRVKKFERDRLCKFRRWGPAGTISLLLGEVMVLRHELQARGRLPRPVDVPRSSPRLNVELVERTLGSTTEMGN